MKPQELFVKNQQLSTEFDLYLLDHPEVADKIPDGALVVFLPVFDKNLVKKNRQLAARLKEKGAAGSIRQSEGALGISTRGPIAGSGLNRYEHV